MRASPPLRFLTIVLGGWAALRTAVLAPLWPIPTSGGVAAAVQNRARPAARSESEAKRVRIERVVTGGDLGVVTAAEAPSHAGQGRPRPVPGPVSLAPPPATRIARVPAAAAIVSPLPAPPGALPRRPGPASTSPRWSLSAWSFVRRGDAPALAAGGLLGGSQAGARFVYRINRDSSRPLAFSARLSSPLRSAAGAEAALGIDWKPVRRLPVHLLAERRQALGREGRSAFAITFHGGVGEAPLGPFRIDSYAQAGLVGTRSRDLFGDGSIRVSLPLGERVRVGAGAWAAAQPGLSRLDFGPQAALRLPVAGRALTLAADWRVRVVGNASPGSGPTLTLSTDF